MKKIFGLLTGTACMAAIFFACMENTDGSCNLPWTLFCLGIAVICGLLWNALYSPQPVHVLDDVYDDLNKQIREYAEGMGNGYRIVSFESDNVVLTVGIHIAITKNKFTDDAWGNPKTFTETNWYCSVEIMEVTVCDENNKPTDNHDFDESYIEIEYEGGGSWS